MTIPEPHHPLDPPPDTEGPEPEPVVTGEAHDTLREELAAALTSAIVNLLPPDLSEQEWKDIAEDLIDAGWPVVRRFADAQVAAERKRIAAAILAEPYADNSADAFRRAYSIARGEP